MSSSRVFTLRPYVSLSGRGFFILMGFVAAVSFAVGLFFASLGAWPVFGFYGLEVVLLYAAFRWTYYRARRCERIEISPQSVTITQISADGDERSWRCHPYWVKLDLLPPQHPADDIGELVFSSRGEYVPVGAFLAPPEKQALHAELKKELHAVLAQGAVGS